MEIDKPYTAIQKMFDIKEHERLCNEWKTLFPLGFLIARDLFSVGVLYLHYCKWKQLIKKVDNIDINSNQWFSVIKYDALYIWFMQAMQVAEIQQELKQFMFQLWDQSIQVTNRMVGWEAACIHPAFKDNSKQVNEVVDTGLWDLLVPLTDLWHILDKSIWWKWRLMPRTSSPWWRRS